MKTKIIYREPLGNPERQYRQDRFVISSCMSLATDFEEDKSDIRECIRNIKEVGCNLTEYIWANPEITEKCVLACEEFGIDGVFQNWNAFGGFQAKAGEMKINHEELAKFMEFNKNYKHFHGYYVWDEPLSEAAVDAAAEQLNIIEELDPERLPFTVAIPSYNATDTWENGLFEKYLRRYAKVVNPPVMSLDYYPFSALRPEPSNQMDDKNLYLDIALLRELSIKMKTPMWFYIQTQDMPMGERYYRFTPARMTMQAYNVLLHGGKGVQYYCTVEGAIYRDGRKGPLFFQMKEMNHRIRQWGKTLMALTSEHVFHSPELHAGNENFEQFREAVTNSQILANDELPFRCSVGEFTDSEGNLYLMILNRDYMDKRTFSLEFKKPVRVYEVSGEDGMQRVRNRRVKGLNLELAPGDAVFLRLQDAQEEAYLVEYALRK